MARVNAWRGLAVGSIAFVACGRAAPPAPAGPDDGCVVLSARGDAAPITLGLVGAVDPAHAPIPSNDAERLLFRQLYEPLVTRDCAGRIHPALAASWRTVDGGRRWLLTLRADARFWDGRRVRAEDVIAAWGRNDPPGAALSATDDSTVSVTFAEPLDQPWPLTDPAYGIAVPAGDGGWPFGTTPPGRVRHVASDDARDLLDGGADVVVTREPAVATYARGLGRYDEFPLAWDRTYVLLNGDALLPEGRDLAAGFVAAVAGFVRQPQSPFWWRTLEGCGYLSPHEWRAPTAVAYPPGDAVARDLAARVVAVSVRPGVRTAPAARALGAVVRAVPRTPFRPCDLARELGLTRGAPTIRALVDTRATLLVRRTVTPAVVVDWDGVPRLAGGAR